MTRERSQPISPHARAWVGIALTTIMAGPASVVAVLFIERVNGTGTSSWVSVLTTGLWWGIFATGALTPVGALGATVCAGIIKHRSLKRTIPILFLCTLLASVLVFFLLWNVGLPMLIVGPAMIVAAQLAASLVSLSVKPDPYLVALDAPTETCAACGYSLAGLDRERTAVCPECGEPLPPIAAR